jgi:2-polyprenyl-6-methoxyphenol hydroxylase-like FAD-dependent oxidoreductase
VPIEYGREVAGFTQDDAGVDVSTADDRPLRAQYLVGCDGGRSAIRKAAGIDFPGWDASISHLIAEIEVADDPEFGIRRDASGTHGFSRVNYEIRDGKIIYADHGPMRVMITEKQPGAKGEPTLQDLRDAVRGVYGRDFGIDRPIWISRFTDMSRQATSYRDRRVLLAGDAAHIHGPPGGQGLNTGVQDAVNLGWKLAQVVTGTSADSLLDSYHAERHPVGARVLQNTMAQTALMRTDDRTNALRTTMGELLEMDEPRKRIAAEITGLGIHYDLGAGHPLLGRRMPDLDLVTPAGTRRVYSLLNDARPVLIALGGLDGADVRGWADRVRLVEATYDGDLKLPVIGAVAVPRAVLVRPDGYVAWVGEASAVGLTDAFEKWFGQV